MSSVLVTEGGVVPMTGATAAARAMRQIDPDVVAAYPITPQTEVVEQFSTFVADGLVNTEFIPVESEHSAMSVCIGASAAGSRAMTATSSQGLAYMMEVVYVASSLRLPIVMALANRALNGPLNIHCDHSDSMSARDASWIQLYSVSVQEVYDNILQAIRIAEHPAVRLPVMVCFDGFITSHSLMDAEVLDDVHARGFVGEFQPYYPLLDIKNPVMYGPVDLFDYHMEHKRQQRQAMDNAYDVIKDVGNEYGDLSGRPYGLVRPYRLDDAEIALVALGSTLSTAMVVVDQLREEGIAAGLLGIRSFRPFPYEEIARHLGKIKAVMVMDRSETFGAQGGPLGLEVRMALCSLSEPPLFMNRIYGLGGREVTPLLIRQAYEDLSEAMKSGSVAVPFDYLGVRER